MKIETALKSFNPIYWNISREDLDTICEGELIVITSVHYETTVEIRAEKDSYVHDITIVTDRIRYLTHGRYEDVYLEKDGIYHLNKILRWIENPLQMKLEVIEAYTKTFKSFIENEGKVIEKYGFTFWEDGIFGAGEDVYYFSYFSHDSKSHLEFCYDILSDEILFQRLEGLKELSLIDDFEKELREKFAEDSRTEYLVSSDPKHTKYTNGLVKFMEAEIARYASHKVRGTKMRKIPNINIDPNHIPEKYKECYNYFLNIKNEQLLEEANSKQD